MADKTTSKDDCTTGSCPVVGDNTNTKLVKVRDLPLLGNPYPPKDVIQEDTPGSLELTVRSIRTTIQPYLAPVCTAYEKTSDFISIGAAHSQSALANLRENQNSLMNALVISGSGLFGIALARRRGLFKKLLYVSVFSGAATAACYPKEAKEKAEFTLFIAKNKLPELFQQQYQNLSGASKSTTSPATTTTTKAEPATPEAGTKATKS